MSAILPPAKRMWWKEPLDRVELTWILIAFVWAMVLFFMMPYWHVFGKQNLSNEAYRISAEAFSAKTQAMVDKYTVRKETDQKIPVVHPPEGSDVYLIARLWQWWPILELENGKSYRLHLSAMDYQHGFSLQPDEHQPAGRARLRNGGHRHAQQDGQLSPSCATSTAASAITRW